MDDYIAKPVRAEDLEAILQDWVPRETPKPPRTPAQEAVDGVPTVDWTVLDGLRGIRGEGELDLLLELTQIFEEDTPARIMALRDALEREDTEALWIGAHGLKGGSGSLGARRMALIAERIEALARAGDLTLAAGKIEGLQR